MPQHNLCVALLMLFNSLEYVCEVGHANDERAAFSGISKKQTKGTEEGFFVLTV